MLAATPFDGSGNIILSHAGNDFVGTVGLRGNSVSIADANVLGLGEVAADRLVAASGGALDLGHGVVAGAAEVRSNGAITQSGAFRVGGDARFDAGSGNIILSHAGNDFVGTVDLRGGAVEIADANTPWARSGRTTCTRAATIDLANDVSTSGDQVHGAELGAGGPGPGGEVTSVAPWTVRTGFGAGRGGGGGAWARPRR